MGVIKKTKKYVQIAKKGGEEASADIGTADDEGESSERRGGKGSDMRVQSGGGGAGKK